MTDNATLARSMDDAWNARDFDRGPPPLSVAAAGPVLPVCAIRRADDRRPAVAGPRVAVCSYG